MATLRRIEITPVAGFTDVVSLAEAKDYCNVDHNGEDAKFPYWIQAAREALQVFTGRVFAKSNVTAVYKMYSGEKSFTPRYSDNMEMTGSYQLNDNGEIEASEEFVTLEYTAGYTTYPAWMKIAVMMFVADMYENRFEDSEKVGERAKQFCKGYINHGRLF